jgi:membrane protease YdiL (CAAX protease family)
MWKSGIAYLQIGWDPSHEKPSFFGILGIIIGSAALFFASLVVCTLLFRGFIPVEIKRGPFTEGLGLYPIALYFLSVALGFLPVLIHLRRKLNCSFTDAFLGRNKVNLPLFLASVAATWATYALFQIIFGQEFRWAFPNADQVIPILFLLVFVLFQSAAEELVFRGYFSKAIYSFGRSIFPVFVVIPVTFALYHQKFDPVMLLVYCEAGVLHSYLSLRTGDLQVSTALHFANNSYAVLTGNVMKAASLSNTGLLASVLAQAMKFVVIALLLETALRIWGMRGRKADESMPPATCDIRSG